MRRHVGISQIMWRNVGIGVEGLWRSSINPQLGTARFQTTIALSRGSRAALQTTRSSWSSASRIHIRSRSSIESPAVEPWLSRISLSPLSRISPLSPLSSSQNSLDPQRVSTQAIAAWRRHASTRTSRRAATPRRNKSSISEGSKNASTTKASAPKAELSPQPKPNESVHSSAPAAAKSLLDRLPHLPHLHRPTKEDLLAAATGFWSRLGIRFKWFSIRSARPFNLDEIVGFFSWILVGHIVWILVGTTTFFSLAILMLNTVFAQESLAKWIGNYLTHSSGLQVVFESAIVPKWGDGVISFSNVFVSRRPGQGKAKVSKGSPAEAAAAAERADKVPVAQDDGNYTQFDVSIDTVNVTLSFAKWFNGKGLLRDVEIKGIRGVIDRTHVQPEEVPVDPRSYRHEHNPGDFEIDSFKMEDLLVTIYQPGNFRPFSVSIFSCDLPRLRKQWLFYDFLSANNVSGSFDNSLFTVHPCQTHNHTGSPLILEGDDGASQWKKQSRLRIDGMNIDHLNRSAEGPFTWIREGNVDIVADVMFPADDDESVAKVISDVFDRVEATVTTNSVPDLKNHHDRHLSPISSIDSGETSISMPDTPHHSTDDENRFLIMDLRVNLNDVRAAVPLFTKDISYVNNALIRPIVAYINSKRTFIPVNCRVVKQVSEFDGSWTLYDSGLMDDLNREVYDAFVRDILDDAQARRRRITKVGIWTIQLAAQALFVGIAGNFA